ncbi:MAG TPA: PQQ-dependent sugar dehydrogenase [Patescibacteria group bacterium]
MHIHTLFKTCLFLLVGAFVFLLPQLIRAQEDVPTPEDFDANDITLESNYAIEPAVINLSVPTTAVFDGQDLLIAESGFAQTAQPRVLRLKPDGTTSVEVSEGLEPPVLGLLIIDNQLYISHRGKVSRVEEDGSLTDIVTGLPSEGDHQNNNISLGPEGKIYLGQGTVTNTGVVGEDNYVFGWLDKKPELHDIPCQDITLRGQNFTTGNPLTDNGQEVITGAYKPFGTPSTEGETINGDVKCNGAILRFNPDGSDVEVVAWGLRNPFGLEFDEQGQLWATYHGADVRGSRPVFNDPDYLLKVEEGAWYGWPDFFDGVSVEQSRFKEPTQPQPHQLWQQHQPLTLPYMTFESHEGTNGLAISLSDNFGFKGQAFIAAFGTFAPVTTGANVEPNGFRIIRADLENKQEFDFASNVLPGPAYLNQQDGLNRPSDVVFGPDDALYVIDWGAATLDEEGLKLVPQTGAIWRIYNTSTQQSRFETPIKVPAEPIPLEERETLARTSWELVQPLLPYLILILGVIVLVILAIIYLLRRP